MSSFLVLSLVVLLAAGAVMAAAGYALWRTGNRALGYWLAGWSALVHSGALALLAVDHPSLLAISPLFTSFVAPLMVMGAAAHSERREPDWLVPVSFAAGVVRSAAILIGQPDLSFSIAIASEPVLAATAAWLVLHPADARPLQTVDRALAAGFVLYGLAEFMDAYSRLNDGFGWNNWIAWITLSLPLATLQIVLHLSRLGRRSIANEDTMRASVARLRILEESSHDFLAEFTDAGILTYVSPGAAIPADRPAEELLGRNVLEFIHPDAYPPLAHAMQSGRRVSLEDIAATSGSTHPAILPDGSQRWFEFLGQGYYTLDDELRIVARIRDVTEDVERQDEIRESSARLKRAERIASLGSWEFDFRTRHLIASEEMYRLHGLSPANHREGFRGLRELMGPEQFATLTRLVERARVSPGPVEQVYRTRRSGDGALRTMRVLGETDCDADGRVLRVVGATLDITELADLNEQLRRGQEKFQSLVDSDVVCVFFAHRSGQISDANAAFLSILGYTKHDLPLSWRTLTAPEFEGDDDRNLAESDPARIPQPFEREFIARDGRRVPMLLAFAMLSHDDVILIGSDLTARKQADAYRERLQRELESTVAERTRELVESRNRLIEAERLAVVGTLAAGVAHQINNPIGAILTCAEYALLCHDDPEAHTIYERALHDNLAEARRCAAIVRSMLQFSRDQPTAKWVEDLNRVVRRAQRAINAYALDRGASIAFETEGDNLLARISPIEIEQVIVNVLRNAIESADYGARVSIRLARHDKSVVIEIADDGRGIDPIHREHLFEPFYSTRTREGGTGLGLSVAHGIITDHGGQIRIESILGTGTRVVILLPAEDGLAPAAD